MKDFILIVLFSISSLICISNNDVPFSYDKTEYSCNNSLELIINSNSSYVILTNVSNKNRDNTSNIFNPCKTDLSSFTGSPFGYHRIGYLEKNDIKFPFEKRIVLFRTIAKEVDNSKLSDGYSSNWKGDKDLNIFIPATRYYYTSYVKFNFTPIIADFSFNSIFASKKYEKDQSSDNYSDIFAFIIKKINSTEPAINLAVLEDNISIFIKAIRDTEYDLPPDCDKPTYSNAPINIIHCIESENESEMIPFELTENANLILGDRTDYNVAFYEDPTDALNHTNQIEGFPIIINIPEIISEKSIYYTIETNEGCFSDVMFFNIKIRRTEESSVSFSYNMPECYNGTEEDKIINPDHTGSHLNAKYTSDPIGLVIDETTGAINIYESIEGSYRITCTIISDDTECIFGDFNTTRITIRKSKPSTIAYNIPDCTVNYNNRLEPNLYFHDTTDDRTFLSDFDFNAVFSYKNEHNEVSGLTLNEETGILNLITSLPGTYSIYYTIKFDDALCMADQTDTIRITIQERVIPKFEINYDVPDCVENEGFITIDKSSFPQNGEFSSTEGLAIDDETGTIDIVNTIEGTYIVTYTFGSDKDKCTHGSTENTSITIKKYYSKNAEFSYDNPLNLCGLNESIVPNLIDTDLGGIFTALPEGLIINNSTGELNLKESIPGTYTIAYTIDTNEEEPCLKKTNHFVEIKFDFNKKNTNFSYDIPVCFLDYETNVEPEGGFDTEGIFTYTNEDNEQNGLKSFNENTGTFNLKDSQPGVYSITYTINEDIETCVAKSTSSYEITVDELIESNVLFEYGKLCKIETESYPIAISGNLEKSGNFSANSSDVIIDPKTGRIDLINSKSGAYIVTFKVDEDKDNCIKEGALEKEITINDAQIFKTNFEYDIPVCFLDYGTNVEPEGGFDTEGIFTYTNEDNEQNGLKSFNENTGTFNLKDSQPGVYSITYTINEDIETCVAKSTSSYEITVDELIESNVLFEYGKLCKIETESYPIAISGNLEKSGNFSANSSDVIIDPKTGRIDLINSKSGAYIITFKVDEDKDNCIKEGALEKEITIIDAQIFKTDFEYDIENCVINDQKIKPITGKEGFDLGGLFKASQGLIINPVTGEIDLERSTIGIHTVTYMFNKDIENCIVASSKTIDITVFGKLEIEFEGLCIAPGKYKIRVLSKNNSFDSQNVSYTWKNETDKNFIASTEEITVSSTGNYTVTITTQDGCETSASYYLKSVFCNMSKGISPNNDGMNDTFDLTELGVKKLSIYNRYGVKVYSLDNYTNQWHGQDNNNNNLPDGTYYYVIETDNKTETGWVYINR